MTALVLNNSQSQLAFSLLIYLFADLSPCGRDPNDTANYTGKTLSDDQKLELLTVKFSFPHGFKFPTTAGGVSNYHGWRSGHGCVKALEMTQLTVFVVYVCPTILVQMNRHLSQGFQKLEESR